MKISTDKVKELREQSGASVMACRNALIQAEENLEKALQLLKQQNLVIVEKKKERTTSQGIIEAYVHGGRIGAMVELNCESDFVARTDEFKQLAHNLAMQVAAMYPKFVSIEAVPPGTEVIAQEACLLVQPFIKDLTKTVQDVINETIAKLGENIKVSRFVRFELGEQ
ncbi:MAG: elongation factor Ts [Chloroflexi bacterium]|nr:elongation factor Ts [Chloroflexota bacterium]